MINKNTWFHRGSRHLIGGVCRAFVLTHFTLEYSRSDISTPLLLGQEEGTGNRVSEIWSSVEPRKTSYGDKPGDSELLSANKRDRLMW